MYVAFFDESGNDGISPVFAMAGLLLHSRESFYFGVDWLTLLKKFDVETFHATDFHGARGEFRGWGQDQRASLELAIIGLFLKYPVGLLGQGVTISAYDDAFVKSELHKRLKPAVSKWKKPYLAGFNQVVTNLRRYADELPGQLIHPTFDECQEFIGQARVDFADRNCDGKLGPMQVSNSRDCCQIQAADFVAYEFRKNFQQGLAAGHRVATTPATAALQSIIQGQLWTGDFLEYLVQRTQAAIDDRDPDLVEAPASLAKAQSNN